MEAILKNLDIAQIEALYPDEWVLLGNPLMDDARLTVFGGIPIYHSKDKKEVCYLGKDKTGAYHDITLIFTGFLQPNKIHTRKITGIFNRVKPSK